MYSRDRLAVDGHLTVMLAATIGSRIGLLPCNRSVPSTMLIVARPTPGRPLGDGPWLTETHDSASFSFGASANAMLARNG